MATPRPRRARKLEGTFMAVEAWRQVENAVDSPARATALHPGPVDAFHYTPASDPHTVPVALLPTFAAFAMDPAASIEQQLQGAMGIRKLLSVDADPPIDAIVKFPGLIDRLIFFLQLDDRPQLQFEAVWSLSNLACERAEIVMMNEKAVLEFIRLLRSPDDATKALASWALGNLASPSPDYRDRIIGHGVMTPLCECVANNTGKGNVVVLRNALWAMNNLCHEKRPMHLAVVQPAITLIARLVLDGKDEEDVFVDAASALSDMAPTQDCIQALLDQNILPSVVQRLQSTTAEPHVVLAALRIVGSIASSCNDDHTRIVIDSGALSCFPRFLTHGEWKIRKEACWTCSNIVAWNSDQIDVVVQAGLLPCIIHNLSDSVPEVMKEAVWTINNIATQGTSEQIKPLMEVTVLEPLCNVLECRDDPRFVVAALEALEGLLAVGEEERQALNLPRNPVVVLLDNNELLHKIQALQWAPYDVSHPAMDILERYIHDEERVDGEAAVCRASVFSAKSPSAT